MTDYLPPLQTLRAFEAAARHLSYTRAAQELSLTHSAVSHHIARLERDLGGTKLFARDGHRMILTDAGQVLLFDVRQGLRLLAGAFENARIRSRRNDRQRPLNVSVHPGLAARWLVPRLAHFQADHPDVEIAIRPSASLAMLDDRDGIDLAIRYGSGQWPDLHSTRLMKSFVFPVASPASIAQHALGKPRDLLEVTLLRVPRQKWLPWFLAAGLNVAEPAQGPIYDDPALVLQAAAAGQGVALARSALVAQDIAARHLIRPFDIEIEDADSWFIVWREPVRCDPATHEAFRQWLMREPIRDVRLPAISA